MTTPVGDPDRLRALPGIDLVAMLDRLSDGILVLADDWTIEYINQPAGLMIGRPHRELLGRNIWQEFPEAVGGRFHRAYEEAKGTGRPQRVIELYEPLDACFETRVFPQGDKLIGLVRDVTDAQRAEDERRERLEWTDRISTAMEQGRMTVFAQPIVATASGERVACELLVRIEEGEDRAEPVPPTDFLLAAERYGLIQEIDTWMVRQALSLPAGEIYQVNLSALTMCDLAARAEILELLRAEPEAARRLVFEITETASVVRLGAARSFAAAVMAAGSRLALDDFGVGFGSFTYLRSLPFSLLKIDSSFVRRLTSSGDDRRVVQGTIGIAREFGIETIAEGVEDEATMEALRELGVDYAQGFHLGRPAPLRHETGASA